MLFKGTDKRAWNRAGKLGKTAEERSKIYYKSKAKTKTSLFGKMEAFFERKNQNQIRQSKPIVYHKTLSTNNTRENQKNKYVSKQIIMDDIRDYKSSKFVSTVSNFIATSVVKLTCKSMTNEQMNFFRSTIALVSSETFNKAFDKPLNVIENIKMFIKISKVIYRVVMYFDEKMNEYLVDKDKTITVDANNNEYITYLKQNPSIKKIEMRAEIMDYLGKEVFVKIDRPLGSTHPKYTDTIYPVNYGYLPNAEALDKEKQDAYVLGINEPISEFNGIVKAIIIRKNDKEDKLIVCPNEYQLTKEGIIEKVNFQEKYFDTYIII